jgi:hypothetical protein
MTHAIADLGPYHQHLTGRLEVIDAPDPDAPNRTIRRARLADPLRALTLTDAQWLAATRHRDNAELAEGARNGDGVGGRPIWDRGTYPAAVLDAVRERREAIQAVGIVLSSAFLMAVEGWQSMAAIDRNLGRRKGTAAAQVAEALGIVADLHSAPRRTPGVEKELARRG